MRETLGKYKSMMATAKQLRGVRDKYRSSIGGSCDKYGIGFNLDDRFSAFKVDLSFDSWVGYFGNSGCSNLINFADDKLVKEKLVDYLNKNYQEIFNKIADEIEAEACKIKVDAEKELELELKALKEVQA